MSASPELPLTTNHASPLDKPGMEWLQRVLRIADGAEFMSPQECADSIGQSERSVQELITLSQLEAMRIGKRGGGHWRITVRSWLVHCWHSWTHRHAATVHQVADLISHLISGLPSDLLISTARRCIAKLGTRSVAQVMELITPLLGDLPDKALKHIVRQCAAILEARKPQP